MRLYNFLTELKFQTGNNSDYPGNSKHVVMFTKEDKYRLGGRTHNSASHCIKHYLEFKRINPSELVNKFNNLITKYEDKVYIGPENPKEIPDRIFSLGTILNTLDLINDKIELNKKVLPIEQKIWDQCVVDYTKEYEKLVDEIVKSATIIKPGFSEDEIKKLAKGTIGFPAKAHDINNMMYVDIPKGIVCYTTRDIKLAKTLFRTSPEGVKKQIAKQTIAYEKIKKALL